MQVISPMKHSPSSEAIRFSASQEIPRISSPCLQAPATCPCPKPEQSFPHPPTLIKVHFNIIPKYKCARILKIQFIPRRNYYLHVYENQPVNAVQGS